MWCGSPTSWTPGFSLYQLSASCLSRICSPICLALTFGASSSPLPVSSSILGSLGSTSPALPSSGLRGGAWPADSCCCGCFLAAGSASTDSSLGSINRGIGGTPSGSFTFVGDLLLPARAEGKDEGLLLEITGRPGSATFATDDAGWKETESLETGSIGLHEGLRLVFLGIEGGRNWVWCTMLLYDRTSELLFSIIVY